MLGAGDSRLARGLWHIARPAALFNVWMIQADDPIGIACARTI